VVELGGKIRIGTLHTVAEVLLARIVTARWLGQLRKVVTVRDILKARPVKLESTEGDADIFSADLSAATDNIPHGLAQHVARRLYERCGAPCELPDLLRMFGPHQLPDGTATSCGIHMGLGPTWIILNILNGFAAWYAGAHKNDHRICGDDLVALWRESRVRVYTQTLEELGLVVNRSKSFFGVAGVFCERLVRMTGTGAASAQDVGHLSHASAAKVIAGRTKERLVVAQDLWSENHFPTLSRQVAQDLTPRCNDRGPLSLGGNGRGYASRKQLETALTSGTVRLVRPPYRLPPKATAELRELEHQQGDVPVSELLIIATTRLRLADNFRGKGSRQARPITNKNFLAQIRSRRHKSAGTKESLLAAIAASPLKSRDKKTATWIASRRGLPESAGGKKWIQRVIRRPRAERYVQRDQAIQWLESISRVPWELGRSQLIQRGSPDPQGREP
jgi:hypothetical protein